MQKIDAYLRTLAVGAVVMAVAAGCTRQRTVPRKQVPNTPSMEDTRPPDKPMPADAIRPVMPEPQPAPPAPPQPQPAPPSSDLAPPPPPLPPPAPATQPE